MTTTGLVAALSVYSAVTDAPETLVSSLVEIDTNETEVLTVPSSVPAPVPATPAPRPVKPPGSTPLNDQTLSYSTNVDRLWLKKDAPRPPAMLLMTNFGWNHPNQTFGLENYRGKWTRDVAEGIVNHPWFHPTAWEDIQEGRMDISNDTRYYVFLDSDLCDEKHYRDPTNYRDDAQGRGSCCAGFRKSYREGRWFWEKIIKSKLYLQAPHFHQVIFTCAMHYKSHRISGEKVSFVTRNWAMADAGKYDQGFIPPPIYPCGLSEQQRQDVADCKAEQRPILFSFNGNVYEDVRTALVELGGDQEVVVGNSEHIREAMGETDDAFASRKLMRTSIFGAAPKQSGTRNGKTLFSYKFHDLLSCATIPVVYADDWLMPFQKNTIDWDEAVVHIPEKDAGRTLEILRGISTEQRCQLRKRALEIYDNHVSSPEHIVATILKGLEKDFAT